MERFLRARRILLAGLLLLALISSGQTIPSSTQTQLSQSVAAPSATTATHEEAGLYLYIGHPDLANFDTVNSTGLSKDFIDGAAIMLQWDEIEPQPDVYNFSSLDKWVLQTVQLHKKLSLGVIAGLFTPAWVYNPWFGVPKNSFNYNRSGTGISCVVMTQPSAWSASYLREYGKMMLTLASHLRGMQGPGMPAGSAYEALRLVKLSGINNTTIELRVDATPPDNGPCHQSDAAAVWAQGGFTPTKVLSASQALASETMNAFPDKLLSLDIIHKAAFPPIDNNGQIYTDYPVPDPLTISILNAQVATYQDRLVVQWDALWQGGPPTEVLTAGKDGARIGWQMNGFQGSFGGSGCIYPGFIIEACKTVADFQSILDNGINLGGLYLEVQVGSVANPQWAPAFEEAHTRLLPFLAASVH